MLLNNLHFYAVIRRRKDECPFFGTCASPKMGPTLAATSGAGKECSPTSTPRLLVESGVQK